MSEIPVHCVIEALPEGGCMKCAGSGSDKTRNGNQKLLDSYAIVDGCTPLSKLNDAVLTALGFPQFASAASLSPSATLPLQNEPAKAKGLIVIDNWKPLTFGHITDDAETAIEHLFKHIGGNRWTLKILVSGADAGKAAKMSADESLLPTTINRIDGVDKSASNDRETATTTDASGMKWYQLFPRYHPYLSNYNSFQPSLGAISTPNIAALMASRLLLPNADVAAAAGGHSPSSKVSPTLSWPERESRKSMDGSQQTDEVRIESSKSVSPKHRLIQQRRSVLVAPRSTVGTSNSSLGHRPGPPVTCRLMFDPLTELPMLNDWFENNSHPTCHDIEKYTDILNAKPYRRTYPPVSTHNVKIWFKNRRAKCKRQV